MTEFKNYITPRGYARLRHEQETLRLGERPQVVDEVATAAAMGDRSENAEYIYGKKRLREIDRRLRWLDKHIESAVVVDPAQDRGDKIYFGAKVILCFPDGTDRAYEIVGADELEPERSRISWRAPIGRAVMGRHEGERVTFHLEDGPVEVEILEVIYEDQEPDPEPDPEPDSS